MEITVGCKGAPHTAECVSFGHPHSLMDRVTDAIVDAVLKADPEVGSSEHPGGRVAIDGVIKSNQMILMGEMSVRQEPDIERIARRVWEATGYGSGANLAILDYIARAPPETPQAAADKTSDQGIMIGYATNETIEMLPQEFVLARRLRDRALECRDNGIIPWIRTDIKTQITLDADGKVASAVIIAPWEDRADSVTARGERDGGTGSVSLSAYYELLDQVFAPVLCDFLGKKEPIYTVKGAWSYMAEGSFIGTGAVGRKIVMDAYGPRIPVGGEGYSGKDPGRLARCGAYMARYIAKTIVKYGMANECLVRIAYAGGTASPVMVSAITEEGRELETWVRDHFDLTSPAILDRLGLRRPCGWNYYDTAAYGHFGYECYPWERVN